MGNRLIPLRYPGTCCICGRALAARTKAWWAPKTRTVWCRDCWVGQEAALLSTGAREVRQDPDPAPSPGGSAQRRYKELRARDEQRIRDAHPVAGGLILFFRNEPQSIASWARGAEGERRVADQLTRLERDGVTALHDRRMPRSRANIDHLAVARNGVWVIDAKNYTGVVERRRIGSWLFPDERLYVDGRDRTAVIDAMWRQVAAVRDALSVLSRGVPVRGVICLASHTGRLRSSPFELRDVKVTHVKFLRGLLGGTGPLEDAEVLEVARVLDDAFAPAVPA